MSTPEERGNVRATKRNIVAHEYAQPRDPSLALCLICANATDGKVYELQRFRSGQPQEVDLAGSGRDDGGQRSIREVLR